MDRLGLRLTVYVRNMRAPTRLAVEAVPSSAGRFVAVIVLVVALSITSLLGARGFIAGMELREGKQITARFLRPQRGYSTSGAIAALDAAQPHYQRALSLWPWYTDVRSAWTDLLVRAERWEQALAQNAIVRRRLDAIEVYFREAWGRFNLGQTDAARQAFQVIRHRSIEFDLNGDGIPGNLPLDPYWASVYFRLKQAFP